MQTSVNGRAFDEAFEGCEKATSDGKYTTYHDGVGVLTLGFGHTNLGGVEPFIKPGDVWTKEQCDAALSKDLERVDADVERIMRPQLLNQNQHDALASFEMNTGHLAKSSIPAKIKAGNVEAAMAALLEYNHAGGKVEAGLTRRRHAERLLYLGQVEAALVLAQAHVATGQPMVKASPPPAGESSFAAKIEHAVERVL